MRSMKCCEDPARQNQVSGTGNLRHVIELPGNNHAAPIDAHSDHFGGRRRVLHFDGSKRKIERAAWSRRQQKTEMKIRVSNSAGWVQGNLGTWGRARWWIILRWVGRCAISHALQEILMPPRKSGHGGESEMVDHSTVGRKVR